MRQQSTNYSNWSIPKHQSSSRGLSLDDACLRVVDAGMWAVVFLAPLFFGGRHNLGRFVFVALCVVTSIAWFVRQAVQENGTWTRTSASVIMMLALAVVCAQLIPLPSEWIDFLSPRSAKLLPIWNADSAEHLGLARWQTLSLAPEETRLAVATLVAYALLFTTTLQRVRTISDIRRVFRWIALSAMIMAGFGLLQYFTSNGRFFWFYDYPYSSTTDSTTGSFSNRNHFAHFLCLGLAALVSWIAELLNEKTNATNSRKSKHGATAYSALDRNSRYTRILVVLVTGVGVVVCAVLLSYSRGAAVALAVVSVVITLLYTRARLISSGHLFGMLGVIVLVVGVLSIHGYEKIAQRVEDFNTGSLESLDERGGRRKIWQANVAAIQSGWKTGAGAGSHRFIYPLYMPDPPMRHYTHAENGPLQIATENGLAGAVLLVWFIGCCCVWCWSAFRGERNSTHRLFAGAITAALFASVIHSLFDFVWFVPTCVAVTLIMAACALRLARLNGIGAGCNVGEVILPRPVWICIATIASIGGGWSVATLFGPACASLPWDRYQQYEIAEHQLLLHNDSLSKEDNADLRATLNFYDRAKTDELRQVVSLQPRHSIAHLQLARSYLRQFENIQAHSSNQMTIAQISDAAINSRFTNAKQLQQWLFRAFGDSGELLYRAYHHIRLSAYLSPLEGESYLLMANLCFLQGRGSEAVNSYVNQALAVRPYDGNVLLLSGRQKLLLGQLHDAVALWSRAFSIVGNHQNHIIQVLAGRVPASLFLEHMKPDWHNIYDVWTRYREVGTQQDWETIEQYARNRAQLDAAHQSPRSAARIWLRLGMMQRELGRNAEAVASLSQGNAVYPNHFHIRHHLGLALIDLQQVEAAEPHLLWCLSRRPDYGVLREALKQTTSKRLGRTPILKNSSKM